MMTRDLQIERAALLPEVSYKDKKGIKDEKPLVITLERYCYRSEPMRAQLCAHKPEHKFPIEAQDCEMAYMPDCLYALM
jgi:hypothetical protein